MKGIIINQDTDGILKGLGRADAPECTAKDIEDFVRSFEGTQITDYFIALFSTSVTYPSKVCTSYLDKYHTKTENGQPVDHSGSVTAKGMHIAFEKLEIDPHEIMIKGFREIGINPWISYRMNDFHYRNQPTWAGFSDFYHEHPEYRRVKFHPEFMTSCADNAYDYYYDGVREHMASIIDESLDRYDPYGIELDFQREMVLFGIGRDHLGVEIMNGFIREVDAIIQKYEKKYGHEIKLAVHVASDVHTCYDFGLDVIKWAREGLVDMVIPGCRFESVDNDIPMSLWKSLLEPYGTAVAAGMDMNISTMQYGTPVSPNIETFAAFANNMYAQGADKIYMYNYFIPWPWVRFDREGEYVNDPNRSVFDLPVYWTVINTLGDPRTAAELNRHHIITYKDTKPFWCHNGSAEQLPVTFPAGRGRGFKIGVGRIPEGATVTVRFGLEDEAQALADIPRVFANSEPCEYIGDVIDTRFSEHRLFCYNVPAIAFETVIYPFIIANQKTTVRYVDLRVVINN